MGTYKVIHSVFEASGVRQDRIHVTLGFTQVTDVCRPNRWVRFLELSEILQTCKTDEIKHELNFNNFVKIKLQAKIRWQNVSLTVLKMINISILKIQ